MKALKLFVVAMMFGMFTVACGGSGSEGAATDSTATAPAVEAAPAAVDTTTAMPADSTATTDTTKKM